MKIIRIFILTIGCSLSLASAAATIEFRDEHGAPFERMNSFGPRLPEDDHEHVAEILQSEYTVYKVPHPDDARLGGFLGNRFTALPKMHNYMIIGPLR